MHPEKVFFFPSIFFKKKMFYICVFILYNFFFRNILFFLLVILNMNKRFFSLSVVFVLIAAILVSCNKDADTATIDNITATLENGAKYNNEISKVILVANEPVPIIIGPNSPVWTMLSSSNFTNSRFSMKLPSTIDDKYLKRINDYFPTNVTVSCDKNTKTEFFPIVTLDMNDNLLYSLVYAKLDGKLITEARYMYSDCDCSITGIDINTYSSPTCIYDEETEEFITKDWLVEKTVTYSVFLKNGWNVIYRIEKENKSEGYNKIFKSEITTKAVSGLKWYVSEDFSALQE